MDEPAGRDRVIFVCTHNSARSQMAEGMLRAWAGDRFDVSSAGTVATQVRPEAIEAMAELGIDISAHSSKTLDRFLDDSFAWLITVCDDARESCPTLPGVPDQEHWNIADPSRATGDHDARLVAFRAAREDLRTQIERFIARAG